MPSLQHNQSKKVIKITRSDFAENTLYLNGAPYSLNDYSHMRTVFNIDAQNIVLQCSRQTSKSTTMAALQVTHSCMMPNYKSLYISPTVDQTKIYSVDRLAPFLESSPWIKKTYLSSSLVQNVFTKKLLNNSSIYLRYALLTADRLRGLSYDHLFSDECQDLILDLIPVIQQGMSRSYHKRQIFSGTPKLSRGTLAHYWGRSTRNEWMVKCPGCAKYNYLDESNIGKRGLVCRFCDHLMDPKNGTWVRTGPANATMEGFRVCALQFANAPWVNWQKDIIEKMENDSRAVFFNEVLGIAYDPGVAPVTEEEIRKCCTNQPMLKAPTQEILARGPIYMGIDYGPANSEHSFTVISIIQPIGDRVEVLFMKKFTGKEADFHYIHNEVPNIFRHWNCALIGADYGLGEASNAEIRSHIGEARLVPFFHTTQKDRLLYNQKLGAYTTSRIRVMTEFFAKIKRQKFIFPRWEDFEPFADDILNVAIDYSLDNTKFKYVNSDADDSLHAILYADMLRELDAPRLITYSYQFEDPNNGAY